MNKFLQIIFVVGLSLFGTDAVSKTTEELVLEDLQSMMRTAKETLSWKYSKLEFAPDKVSALKGTSEKWRCQPENNSYVCSTVFIEGPDLAMSVVHDYDTDYTSYNVITLKHPLMKENLDSSVSMAMMCAYSASVVKDITPGIKEKILKKEFTKEDANELLAKMENTKKDAVQKIAEAGKAFAMTNQFMIYKEVIERIPEYNMEIRNFSDMPGIACTVTSKD